MPAPNPRVKATGLKPGQYFKDGSTWYLVESVPVGQPDPDYRVNLTVRDRAGHTRSSFFVYAASVEVSPGNRRPSTWQPSALRREADRIQRKADRMLALAAGLRTQAEKAEKAG